MSFIVKITTKVKLFDLICPHHCISCGKIGVALCDCCKNYNIIDHVNYCPLCKRPTTHGECGFCNLPPTFMVGWRDEMIGKLIHHYKYEATRTLAQDLAELLDGILPAVTGKVYIVPLPTIRKHIRERGFDHMLLLAQKLARIRNWQVAPLLRRAKDTVQVGADMKTRVLQARDAYYLDGKIDNTATYILLDDVWTTGASMKSAMQKLINAGAEKLVITVLAVSRTRSN